LIIEILVVSSLKLKSLQNKILNYSSEKYNFCTIFDSAYYAKGMALYYSLKNVCNFHLFIFSPDEKCINKIEDKKLPNVTLVHFKDFCTSGKNG